MQELDIYLSLHSEYYTLSKPTALEDELELYLSYCSADPILEPMCGAGRFLLPILQRGYDIEGYDASPYMLALLRQKAKQLHLKPNVRQQFIGEHKVNKQYGLIFIPSGSFSLIADEEYLNNFLRIVYTQLKPGGKFVFEIVTIIDLSTFYHWRSDFQDKDKDTYIIYNAFRFPPSNNVSLSIERYELVQAGKILQTEMERISIRLFTPNTLLLLLQEHGFKNTKIFRTRTRQRIICEASV